jgi:hypothetical protein
MHVAVPSALKAKLEAPGFMGTISERGCADASLYRRFREAGLTRLTAFPHWTAFSAGDRHVVDFLEAAFLGKLEPQEADEWKRARRGGSGRHVLHDVAASLRDRNEGVNDLHNRPLSVPMTPRPARGGAHNKPFHLTPGLAPLRVAPPGAGERRRSAHWRRIQHVAAGGCRHRSCCERRM